jgi:hypothetical protein
VAQGLGATALGPFHAELRLKSSWKSMHVILLSCNLYVTGQVPTTNKLQTFLRRCYDTRLQTTEACKRNRPDSIARLNIDSHTRRANLRERRLRFAQTNTQQRESEGGDVSTRRTHAVSIHAGWHARHGGARLYPRIRTKQRTGPRRCARASASCTCTPGIVDTARRPLPTSQRIRPALVLVLRRTAPPARRATTPPPHRPMAPSPPPPPPPPPPSPPLPAPAAASSCSHGASAHRLPSKASSVKIRRTSGR